MPRLSNGNNAETDIWLCCSTLQSLSLTQSLSFCSVWTLWCISELTHLYHSVKCEHSDISPTHCVITKFQLKQSIRIFPKPDVHCDNGNKGDLSQERMLCCDFYKFYQVSGSIAGDLAVRQLVLLCRSCQDSHVVQEKKPNNTEAMWPWPDW